MDKPFSARLDALIKAEGATWEKTSVCTSWLLITEWVDGDGVVWLEEHRTADMPAWRRQGILYYIMDTPIEYEEEDYDG